MGNACFVDDENTKKNKDVSQRASIRLTSNMPIQSTPNKPYKSYKPYNAPKRVPTPPKRKQSQDNNYMTQFTMFSAMASADCDNHNNDHCHDGGHDGGNCDGGHDGGHDGGGFDGGCDGGGGSFD